MSLTFRTDSSMVAKANSLLDPWMVLHSPYGVVDWIQGGCRCSFTFCILWWPVLPIYGKWRVPWEKPPLVSPLAEFLATPPKINGELACRLCLVNCDSKWCKAPKALCIVRFINLSRARPCLTCWSHSEAQTRVANISIELLGVHSWPYPVVTLGAWHSGQGSVFTYSKFGGSESESRQSHTFLTCAFFPFSMLIIFSLLLVSLYSHWWSFKAPRGFCDNVFLVYVE